MKTSWMDLSGLRANAVKFLPSLRRGLFILTALTLLLGISVGGSVRRAAAVPQVSATFVDVTPDNEGSYAGQPAAGIPDCPAPCESGLNGGRVHNLAAVPGDASTYFAASEVGGLFESTDGGHFWSHLDGYLPGTAWDVAAAAGGQRVFATSFNEGRLDLTTVLQVSTDGGITWDGRLPNAPSTCPPARAGQPSGFGIAVRPGSNEVLAGTNCGLARTTDGGDSWTRFDPTPGDEAGSVWDVVALPGGRTYACGDDGLLISPSGAAGTWTALAKPASTGSFCSLAVSPEETYVVFAMFGYPTSYGELFAAPGGRLFQGVVAFDTGTGAPTGVTWLELPNPDASIGGAKTRLPFVVTNDRSNGYDVWTGIGNLVRGTCSTPSTPPAPNTARCTVWSATYTDKNGTQVQNAHGDSGDVVFDSTTAVDACPTLYSSDGGIYRNDRADDPTMCQDPLFVGSNAGLHAFMLWDMEGVSLPGSDAEALYFGSQDNGLYYTGTAGADTPSWNHRIGGDTYEVAADSTGVAASTNAGELLAGAPGFVNMVTAAPPGVFMANPPLDIPEFIARAGGGLFMIAVNVATSVSGTTIPVGVWQTADIVNDPFQSQVGSWTSAAPPCHIAIGAGAAGPQPYVLAGRCFWPDSGARSPFAGDQLWTYRDVSPGVPAWIQIAVPPKYPGDPVAGGAGFGLMAVDPANADRLYASVVGDGDPRMMRSTDGGASWTFDEQLTNLMSGGGTFVSYPVLTGDGIFPYLQPLMVAFDPADPNLIVAGAASSGVFFSTDAGTHWSLLTDPLTSGTSGIPHLPRPMFAHFDHDKPGFIRIYLGTGRGIWRVELPTTDLQVTKTAAPDPAYAGELLTYTVTVANNSQSDAMGVTVTDVLPSGVTYTGGSPGCTESPVGTLSCSVGGLTAGTETSLTITVAIAPDLVYTNGGPKTITNTATASSEQVDTTPANNTASTDTLVKAKADIAIVSFEPVAPPTEIVIGHAIDLILRKIVTNHGPSSPVDVSLSRTATAPAGSTVTPATSSGTATALVKDELRTVDETFTIICNAPGAQTFSFANTITLASTADVDPDPDNNTATASVTVTCVVPVAINIRPGSFPNILNLHSTTHVAVLTTTAGEYGLPLAFDATMIQPESVRFGPEALVFPGTGGAPAFRAKDHIKDAQELDEKTKDKDLDMVLQFRVGNTGLTQASTEACVKGTFTGTGGAAYEFFGCDSVQISP
jgi:uncharacterized repeat protein (TIGR01451 family)